MPDETPILEVAKQLGLTVMTRDNADLRKLLVDQINVWLQSDFDRLIAILYRMDVSEQKLRQFLRNNPGQDAGEIIADLMIERQVQKIRSRRDHQRDNDIDENEKW